MEDKSKLQDSIVVAGIACRFPDSKNVNEFWDYLCKNGDKTKSRGGGGGGFFALLTGKNQSNDPNRFDASFFEMSPEDVKQMSPDLRTILELSYESIIDSGSHPKELIGSNIGVYVSSSSNLPTNLESHLQDESSKDTAESGRDILVKKIADYFDFKGPQYCHDGDSSSPLLAIHQALMDIRNGNCEGAVIGARTNLRKSKTSDAGDMDQQKKSIVSVDDSRTDAIVAVYITKQSLCRRAYAHLVNTGTNITGAYAGTTNGGGPPVQELIQQVCSGICISVDDLEYLESHCSGSKADDPHVSRIVQLFSQNRSTETPLLFGSTTFEVAQNKVSSELASFIKTMLICNNEVIPPGHYLNSADLQTLENKVKIVQDTTKFNGGYVAINASRPDGFDVLVIIKPFSSAVEMVQSEMPKLVVCSSRSMNGLRESIKYVSKNKEKGFFYTLSNPVANAPVQRMPYRGYQIDRTREIKKIESTNYRPVWYIFAGVGSQWPGLAKDMMNLPRFKESILRSHETLDKVDPEFNLLNLLLDSREDTFNSVIKTFVGIACVQVALINCLKGLGITPDGYFGHSVGEVACAYVDGALTEEQAVLVAYWRGRSIVDPGKIYGAMASVGMSWEEAAKRLPPGVVLGCNNSAENITISGDQEPVYKCMKELEDEGFYVSEIDTSGAAYHSHQIAEIAPIMTKALEDLNLTRTLRSPSWISTSYAEELWDTEEAKWCDSRYLTNNLVSPVLFHEAASKVPPNAITIEIAPHCLMQSTLKRSLHDDCEILSLMNRKEKDNLHYFLINVGKLYTAGVDVNLNKLYSSVTYPVGVGTPSLSPIVEWDHATKWDETSNERAM